MTTTGRCGDRFVMCEVILVQICHVRGRCGGNRFGMCKVILVQMFHVRGRCGDNRSGMCESRSYWYRFLMYEVAATKDLL